MEMGLGSCCVGAAECACVRVCDVLINCDLYLSMCFLFLIFGFGFRLLLRIKHLFGLFWIKRENSIFVLSFHHLLTHVSTINNIPLATIPFLSYPHYTCSLLAHLSSTKYFLQFYWRKDLFSTL